MATVLTLTADLFIAKGGHRICYKHPSDNNLCVKIHLNKIEVKETERELKYYAFLTRRRLPCNIIPAYFGTTKTNLGKGYIYQAINDYTGETSRTLEHYIKHDRTLEYDRLLVEFEQQAIKQRLITKKLKPYNLLLQFVSPTNKKLVLIDNLGSSAHIPLAYYSKLCNRIELDKRFKAFHRLLEKYITSLETVADVTPILSVKEDD